MANENKEIGEFVRKCKILLLDIEGTTTSISFVKDKLFPYAEENVKKFLESEWETDDVKEIVNALRKLAIEDKEKSVDGFVAIPGEDASKEDQIEGVVNNVKWQMSADRKAGPLKQLQGLIWKQGYDNGEIKGHVFDDVSNALEQWHSIEDQKVYIYSSGSVQAQKLLFGQSLAGDLLKYIDGHFDTAVGAKQESTSYKSIIEKIGCNPEDVLFLTDIVKEAEAARSAGLHVALVSREGNAALPDEAVGQYPVIHSLAQLTVSNKRKTDPQEDDQPAKIPKTDTTEDLKSDSKPENTDVITTSGKMNESEKMEVEEVIDTHKDETVKEFDSKVETKESTTIVVEEVTDMKDITEPVCDIQPIITEVIENANSMDKEIEKMDTEIIEKQETIEKDKTESKDAKISESSESTTKENNEQKETPEKFESAVPKETLSATKIEETSTEKVLPTVITEIVEITNDKESLCEVTDVIEGMEPIVEEPVLNEDMEELQNVGDVLEKECDEILSKVQDVTNLDSIPVKPLLNPIEEESMENENTDTNDIVDGILDSELELEMKQNADAVKTTVIVEDKNEKTEISKKSEDTVPNANDVSNDNKTENSDNSDATKKANDDSTSTKEPETVNNVSVEQDASNENSVSEKEKVDSNNTKSDVKMPSDSKSDSEEKSVLESKLEEGHLNGKATNGETEVQQNGDDTSNDEELKSRLTVENGKEIVNGSNGDSKDVENGLSDKKTEPEVSEIKVKTVTTDEPAQPTSTELIEQPTEA